MENKNVLEEYDLIIDLGPVKDEDQSEKSRRIIWI